MMGHAVVSKTPLGLRALLVIFFCLLRADIVRSEGAGSQLADVSQCTLLFEDLVASRVGLLSHSNSSSTWLTPILVFNETLYGPNHTRFLHVDLSNATVSPVGVIADESLIITASLTTGNNAGDEAAQQAAEGGAGSSRREFVMDKEPSLGPLTPEVVVSDPTSLEGIAIGSDDEISLVTLEDPFTTVFFDDNQSVELKGTLREELARGEQVGKRLEAIADDVVTALFPESCKHIGITLNEAGDEAETSANDTVVTLTTDEEGNDIRTTCVTTLASLENQTMRVHVIGDETEAIILDDGISLGGYLGETFSRIREAVPNLEFAYINLTMDSLSEYPRSPWSACIWDLHKGRLDVCLGEFYDTPDRRELTEMSAMISLKSVSLVALRTGNGINYSGLLQPFTPGLWALIWITVVIFAVLLWFFSYKRETADFGEDFSEPKRFAHSVHLSLQSLVGAALVNDIGEPSNAVYWISSGYAIFVMVIIAAYTANLAAMLTVQKTGSQFNNIQEMVSMGHMVCVPHALVPRVKVSVGEIPMMQVSTVQEALDDIDNGLCAGAIIQIDAMHFAPTEHCDSKVVIQENLFSIPTSIPVRMRYEGLVSKHISRARENGVISNYYRNMLKKMSPNPCGTLDGHASDDSENQSLSAVNAMPLFGLVGLLFLIGIIVHLWERWTVRRSKAGLPPLFSMPKSSSNTDEVDVTGGGNSSPDRKSDGVSVNIDFEKSRVEQEQKEDNAIEGIFEQLKAMQASQRQMHSELQQQMQILKGAERATSDSNH